MIAGAHGGVSVDANGATHQALEDLFAMQGLPNMSVVVLCDVVETRKATNYLLLQHKGPKYIRFAREATPVVTDYNTPFVFGQANVIRLRREGPSFLEAFETVLAASCNNEQEDLSIVACGPMVPEAMRAAYILKKELGYETRIVNIHTLKPIDAEAIIRAARETGVVVTAEEHQIGALAWRVSGILTESPELYGVPGQSERPLRRLRRSLGVDQGIRSERRAHRAQGRGADRIQEEAGGREAGRARASVLSGNALACSCIRCGLKSEGGLEAVGKPGRRYIDYYRYPPKMLIRGILACCGPLTLQRILLNN
jgi:Transketolase, C-terminal domain/Transketolase, pyrimidine binding domain